MANNQNTSTLQSYIDSASGAIQSGIASITGSAGDQANADQAKSKAELEHGASQTAVKAGPFSVGAEGGVAKDNTDRTDGSYNQTVGSIKETAGNLLGNESLKQSGRDQNAQGQAQEAKGQLSDLGQGVSDRVSGAVGGAFAGLTGDRAGQAKYADQHDEGKARQRGVEMDLTKQAEAAEKSEKY